MSVESQKTEPNRCHSVSVAVSDVKMYETYSKVTIILKFGCTPWLANNIGFPLKPKGFPLEFWIWTTFGARYFIGFDFKNCFLWDCSTDFRF